MIRAVTSMLVALAPAQTAIATSLPGPGAIAAGLLGALVAIAALSLLMRRRPEAFPLLAIAALPFRLPISTDGRTVNLLIPLYLVVAAGTIALLVPRWLSRDGAPRRSLDSPAAAGGRLSDRGDHDHGAQREQEPARARARSTVVSTWLSPRGLEWLLLAAVVLYALQAGYSTDRAKAAENIAFFYIPFGLLFMLLRDVCWTRELILSCLGIAVALAVAFAGIGFVEYYRKALFLNPKVIAADQYGNYFRVNSLFFDPNIYGRFLAIVMIAVTTIVLWTRHRREVLIAAGVLAWLLAGLITSFSQSSIAALLLGMTVLAAYRWDARATVYVAVALLAIVLVVVIAAPPSLHFGLKGSGGSTSNATSGRTKLIDGGLELFADRPLWGYGSGSFETEYRRHGDASAANAVSASHTIPITVAAEQGIVGLAVYVALLAAAFATLFRGTGRSPPHRKPGDADASPFRPEPGDICASPFRLAIAACFAALVLHTWTYADFLEDPITWTLLGIGVALARGDGRRAFAAARASEEDRLAFGESVPSM
jgi:O-antigen ligase